MDIVRNDFIGAKTFNNYVKEFFGDRKKLSISELESLFLIFIRDFYSYKLSLDHLSNYSSWIADRLEKHGNTLFENSLVAAFELTYYIRKIGYSENSDKQLVGFMNEVKEYFEKNKHKIKNKGEQDTD